MKIISEQKAIAQSYGRSVLAAAVATYTATQDWKLTLNALWAAVIPVVMRYANPNDKAYGVKVEGYLRKGRFVKSYRRKPK